MTEIKEILTDPKYWFQILPYFGRYHDWKRLMMLLWKDTHKLFRENIDKFLTTGIIYHWNIEKMTLWDNTEDIEKYLELFSNKKNRLGENCHIVLDLTSESSQELLRLLSEQVFPSVNQFSKYSMPSLSPIVYNSVTISDLDHTSTAFRKDVAYFLDNWIPEYIKSFSLGGGCKVPAINSFKTPLSNSLPNVLGRVRIGQVKITNELLKSIIEGASNCRELCLEDWKFTIRKNLSIREDLDYKFTKFQLLG